MPMTTTPTLPPGQQPAATIGTKAAEASQTIFQFAGQHKFVIVACAVLGVAAGVFWANRKREVFAATARVHVDKRDLSRLVNAADLSNVGGSVLYDYLATQGEVISSMDLLMKAVERKKLWQLPTLREAVAGLDMEGDREAQVKGVRDVALYIQERLQVRQLLRDNKPTQVMEMLFKCHSRDDSMATLHAIIEQFKEYHKASVRMTAKDALDALFKKQGELERNMSNTETSMRKMRRESGIIGASGDTVIEARYTLRGSELIKLEAFLAEAEQFYNTLRKIKEKNPEARDLLENLYDLRPDRNENLRARASFDPNKKLELLGEIELEEAKQTELRQVVGEKHPDFQASIRRLDNMRKKLERFEASEKEYNRLVVENLVEAARLKFEDTNNKVNRLRLEVAKAREDALDHITKVDEYQSNVRSLRRIDEQLAAIVGNIGSVKTSEDTEPIKINTLEVSSPVAPIEPNIYRSAMFGGLAGIMLGMGFAYLISVLDQSVRSPDELQELTGAPVLGVVPLIDNRRGLDYPTSGRWVETHSRSSEAESYRTVRTHLNFGNATRNAKVLLVTSPLQGDGKSTTAANLAASLAQNGQRVLLVEADLRRPVQHRIYELDGQVGLTSALSGNASIDDIIVRTPLANLDLAPAGPVPPNPAELLSSPEFDRFIRRARETYDRVVIDSPPMLMVADSRILAGRVDATLLVVNIDRATKRGVSEAARNVAAVGGRVCGVIINMIDPREQAYYQYYYYGGYYNRAYYGRREADTRTPAAAAPPALPPRQDDGNRPPPRA